jgi:Carboxypeptidase regulatory-like domain/TonB dependent receptor
MKRLQKPFFSISAAIFCTLFFGISGFAQTITATISGTVNDPTGAIVPGATVSATSNETGLTKSSTSNGDGRYVITFLQPGTYTIKVAKQGFADTENPNIKLETAQSISLDIKLSVTAEKASVEVKDDQTQLLVTESSGLESTIENKLVEDLPSGERSALAFINLVPGAIDGGFAQGRGEGLNENGNAQGPIGSPGNRNFFDSNFSVNGGRSATNDVLLDGVSNTIGDFNGIAVSPPQDSIREFKVVAGAYSSEYGRSGGGVVSISTKSGGKRYSGALYEYFQDGSLNANGWQRNRRGVLANGRAVLPRQDISRHQYGGTFSGPVRFFNFGEGDSSKGFKKFDKTFFFFNYEGRRERNPFSREITLPTARMRNGDLGELLTGTPYTVTTATTRTTWATAGGAPVITGQIFNPYGALVPYTQSVTNIATGVVTTSTVQGRAPFAGNNLAVLPACSATRTTACIDPVALAVLRFLPSPNTPGLVNNYVASDLAVFNRSIYAGRIDHTFSEKHSIFGRYTYERRFTSEPNYFGGSPAANVRKVKDTFGNFTLNDVYNLSGSLVNNFRYGYTRARANQIPESQGFDPTLLGLPSYLKTFAPILKFPDLTIGGGTAGSTLAGEITSGQIGGAGNNQPRDTHTFADGITFVKGNQTIKIGGEYRLYRFYPFQFFNPTGNFSFNRVWTRGPIGTTVPTIAADSGSSLASFFLGLPSGGVQEAVAPATILHKYPAVYVQDDWKINRRLVLNLGVRWDYETGTEETHGLITNFDLNANAPVQPVFAAGTTYDSIARGLNPNLNNGVKGLLGFTDKPQSSTSKKRFAPRVGFAFSLNDKTTVRGGYGLYYVPLSLEATTVQGTNFSTNLAQSNQAGQIVNGIVGQNTTFLSDPFPVTGTTALATPPGTLLGNRTRLGQQVFAVEPRRSAPYSQQWNVVFQRELFKNTVLDIGYVGGRGINLPIQGAELNQISGSVIDAARASLNTPNSCGTAVTTLALTIPCPTINAFFNQLVNNPFAGQLGIPGSSLNGPTVSRLTLLRPFPQYTSVQLFRPHWGDSYYHALQVNLQRRFTNGLSATVNYTWSKSLDTGGVGNGAAFLDSTAIQDIYAFKREKSLSTFDVPHRFVASWSYELPFGKKKWIGSGWNGITNALLGGWQTAGSYSIQTGTPIAITVPPFTTGLGNASTRPNRLPGNATLSNAVQSAKNGGVFFDTSLFQLPADFVLGNAARTFNDVRRDRYRTLNLSVLKNFYWAEGRQKLQLRAEFLNAFNWVVLGTPVTTLGSGAVNANLTGFGQIRTQGNTPRNIQLVARYTF